MRLNKQRGVAVITALLLCTLAVSIVASLFWQQQVQVRSMENQRLHLQTKWILRGALDWARLVLQTSGQQSGVTTLNDVWNTPLAETRLDQYIERERVEGEVFDATLSGRVIDASSRYNLRHLSTGPQRNPNHELIYANLLRNLQFDPALARKTADYIRSTETLPAAAGQTAAPVKSLPVGLKRVEDLLAIPGYTPEIVARLREFVIVLPYMTSGGQDKHGLNVNTAPAEVLGAVIRDFSLSEAQALVARRKQASFRDIEGFKLHLNNKVPIDEASLTVNSNFFLVQSRIRLDRANLDSEALVERLPGATTVVAIRQN
ncbi:MAG TPA: type II secretion system minor pseudopilin GspK [Telluria sp.]